MSNLHPFMHFDVIPDYRQQGKIGHKLTAIILLTICAALSGQDDWKAISLYGETRLGQGRFMNMPMFKGVVTW